MSEIYLDLEQIPKAGPRVRMLGIEKNGILFIERQPHHWYRKSGGWGLDALTLLRCIEEGIRIHLTAEGLKGFVDLQTVKDRAEILSYKDSGYETQYVIHPEDIR